MGLVSCSSNISFTLSSLLSNLIIFFESLNRVLNSADHCDEGLNLLWYWFCAVLVVVEFESSCESAV